MKVRVPDRPTSITSHRGHLGIKNGLFSTHGDAHLQGWTHSTLNAVWEREHEREALTIRSQETRALAPDLSNNQRGLARLQ